MGDPPTQAAHPWADTPYATLADQGCAHPSLRLLVGPPQVRDHGAVLFRGFPLDTPEDFAALQEEGLGIENLPCVGGASAQCHPLSWSPTPPPTPPHSRNGV